MKLLAPILALALTACATTSVTLPAKKGLTAASALYASACGAVSAAHDAGSLKGKSFNDAKKTCIYADDLLDAADQALILGDDKLAAEKVQAAFILLEKIEALTPEN